MFALLQDLGLILNFFGQASKEMNIRQSQASHRVVVQDFAGTSGASSKSKQAKPAGSDIRKAGT